MPPEPEDESRDKRYEEAMVVIGIVEPALNQPHQNREVEDDNENSGYYETSDSMLRFFRDLHG